MLLLPPHHKSASLQCLHGAFVLLFVFCFYGAEWLKTAQSKGSNRSGASLPKDVTQLAFKTACFFTKLNAGDEVQEKKSVSVNFSHDLLCLNMTIWRCRPRFDYACFLRVKDMEIWMSQNMWCSQVLFFTIPHFHSFGFVVKKSGYDKKLNMLESLGKHNKNKLICTLQSSESLVSWKTSPTVMSS